MLNITHYLYNIQFIQLISLILLCLDEILNMMVLSICKKVTVCNASFQGEVEVQQQAKITGPHREEHMQNSQLYNSLHISLGYKGRGEALVNTKEGVCPGAEQTPAAPQPANANSRASGHEAVNSCTPLQWRK